jgi:hypothetical protein
MGCKMGWTDAYCSEILGGFMHGTYRNHTKALLWEIEKARMPETMPVVERVIKIRKMKEEETKLAAEMEEARRVYENLRRTHHILGQNIRDGNVDGSSKEEMEQKKRSFHRACPVADCTGFLSSQWKCGVCETWTCKDCMEVIGKDKEAEHVCNPDVLASAQLLKKETKPCPSCSAAIYKISGCDQMWCTQCKVAFSWKTGLKVHGTIHNPHFYEWRRKNGGAVQNPGAVACGGVPAWGNYLHRLQKLKFPHWEGYNYIDDCVRNGRIMQAYLAGSGVQYGESSNLWHLGVRREVAPDTLKLMVESGVTIRTRTNPEMMERIPLKCFDITELHDMNKELTGNVRLELKTSKMALHMYRLMDYLQKKHRAATHFQNVELDRLRRHVNRQNNDNEMDRVQYILKELPEKQFKTKLIKKDRKQKKQRAILDIFEVFNGVMRDCVRAIYDVIVFTKFTSKVMFETIREQAERMENVRKYANTELLKISKTYKQVVPYIKRDGYASYETVKYEGEIKKRAEEVGGIEHLFDRIVGDKKSGPRSDNFNYSIPCALRKGYLIPKRDKNIEAAYKVYRGGMIDRRRRY